jgi:hypothetical protein
MVVWLIVVGTSELLSGSWKPWRGHPHEPGSNRSPVVAFVHPPTPDGDEARRVIWIHHDGTITERGRAT